MENKEIFDKVAEMLAEKVECETSEITEETPFEEFGFDSLDMTEMVMNASDEFGVELEMDPNIKTVGQLVSKIAELKD